MSYYTHNGRPGLYLDTTRPALLTMRVCDFIPTLAEREAYAELGLLAMKWQKRNTAERVTNALQVRGELPFTET